MEYSPRFSGELIKAASYIHKEDAQSFDAKRTVLYLSLLSCEITLKALLEKVGMPIEEIKKLGHDLEGLLQRLAEGTVEEIVDASGKPRRVPATRVRGINVDPTYNDATIGKLLSLEKERASSYPNAIRYGQKVCHVDPPKLILNAAEMLLRWAEAHWDNYRLPE